MISKRYKDDKGKSVYSFIKVHQNTWSFHLLHLVFLFSCKILFDQALQFISAPYSKKLVLLLP